MGESCSSEKHTASAGSKFSLLFVAAGLVGWGVFLAGALRALFDPAIPRWFHPRTGRYLRQDLLEYLIDQVNKHPSPLVAYALDGLALGLGVTVLILLLWLFRRSTVTPLWEKGYMFFSTVLVLLLVDLYSKLWVFRHFAFQRPYPLLDNILWITYAENTGMAWSLLEGWVQLLSLASVLAILFILYFLKTSWHSNWMVSGLCLILGGALGNLYDRAYFGYVRDFIDFRIWPIFNLADTFICVGAGLIVYYSFFIEGKEEKEAEGSPKAPKQAEMEQDSSLQSTEGASSES